MGEANDPSEMGHGELFRTNPRQLEPGATWPRDRTVLWMVVLAATAASFTSFALFR